MSKSIEFLRHLAEQLHTQDNLLTASPNYTIQEEVLVTGLDEDYGCEVGWFDDDGGSIASEAESSELEAKYQETGKWPDGWIRTGYRKDWEYTGMSFLTKDAADCYVARNCHKHRGPIRVYVDSHNYNAEMKEVRRLLAGPVVECIAALQPLLDLAEQLAWVAPEAERAKAAMAALDTAKEPQA